MSAVNSWRLPRPQSESDMCRIANWLSGELQAGDIVLFDGVVGAGKSFLAREIIYCAGFPREQAVPSPTFTLVNEYEIDRVLWMHLDLYRLQSPDELLELGLGDEVGDAIFLIEWGASFADTTAKPSITLSIEVADVDHRYVTITGECDRIKTLEKRYMDTQQG